MFCQTYVTMIIQYMHTYREIKANQNKYQQWN